MSNTNGRYLEGTEIKGNLSVIENDCGDGDGSIELSGILFVNEIKKYDIISPGVIIENVSLNNGTITIPSTIQSTNLTTGSLVSYGGISIAKDSSFFGTLQLNNTSNSFDLSSGSLIVKDGGVAIHQNLNIGGLVYLFNTTGNALESLGKIYIQNTINSTSITNGGALTISGGTSIYKDLYVGGTINSTSINSNYASLTNIHGINTTFQNILATTISSSNILSTNNTVNNLLVLDNCNVISNIYLLGASSGSVTLKAPDTITSYSLTFPNSGPATNGSIITTNTSGNLSFDLPTLMTFYNQTSLFKGVQIWTGNTTSVNGRALFYPTSDGTSSGTAIFSNIFHTSATATKNINNAIDIVLTSLNDISINKKIITFNIVSGSNNGIIFGGNTLKISTNGTSVSAFILGI